MRGLFELKITSDSFYSRKRHAAAINKISALNLVLEDRHFSDMLKQPRKIEDPREEQCPKIQFKVLNLGDPNDYMELQSIIKNL